MQNLKDEVIRAIDIAIEGQKWLHYKWEGEYGDSYSDEIKAMRLSDIEKEKDKLYQLKSRIKSRKRL